MYSTCMHTYIANRQLPNGVRTNGVITEVPQLFGINFHAYFQPEGPGAVPPSGAPAPAPTARRAGWRLINSVCNKLEQIGTSYL